MMPYCGKLLRFVLANALWIGLPWMAFGQTQEVATLKLLNDPVVIYLQPEAKSASVPLRIRNEGNKPVEVILNVTDFKSKTSGLHLGATTRLFDSEKQATPTFPEVTNVVGGQLLTLRAEITNLWQAGEAEARIVNGTNPIGTLRVVRDRVPFNIKLITASPNGEVVFSKGRKTHLELFNEDSMTYVVDWRLRIGDIPISGTNLLLSPNSKAEIEVASNDNWFDPVEGIFRDEIAEANLTLAFHPPATIDSPNWPRKGLPFKARLKYVSAAWSYLPIFGMLLLGSVCSLFLHLWVPNQLKRSEVKGSINDLRERIQALSCQIDSRPRVFADVELSRVEQQVSSRNTYSADLPKDLESAQKQLKAIEQRLELMERIDAIFDQIARQPPDVPTPFLESATSQLESAADLLAAIQVSDADLEQAKKHINIAVGWVAMGDEQQRSFAEGLAAKIKDLLTIFRPPIGGEDGYAEWRAGFAALFNVLKDENTDASKIRKERFTEFFIAVWTLDLLRAYAAIARAADPEKAQRLLTALQRGTCDGLREAKAVLAELRGGPTLEEIRATIQARKIRIETNSPVVLQNHTVDLYVQFDEARFNAPEVRSSLDVIWNFDHDGLWENAWEVAHYFPAPKSYKVSVRFRDGTGACIKDLTTHEDVILSHELTVIATPVARFGERARIEIIQLGIVLFIALLGLLAGAREQFVKLDIGAGLIAVFLLGFSADTIKNLLTRKTQP
jgi:hypothetical protein